MAKMFYQKLNNIKLLSSYEIIVDPFLIRHFLHNQQDDSLFDEIQRNLLAVFGGKGEQKGRFGIPTALEEDREGLIYVLDRKMGKG